MIIVETESKLVYPEFKYFKGIYTTLNIAQSITFFPYNHEIYMIFSKDSPYYVLTGHLKQDTVFTKWLRTVNAVTMNLSEINILAKTLKKNASKFSYENSNFFKFSYIDKETGKNKNIKLENNILFDTQEIIDNYLTINFSEEYEIPETFLNNEICVIYKDTEGNITTNRSRDKIIEIPSARLRSLIKNGINKIYIGNRNTLKGNRLIAVESSNSEMNLTLTQIFNTI